MREVLLLHTPRADALAAYPNHHKRFDICKDASDYQVDARIMQDGCPVAYFSQKLNSAKQNYTVTEKEMLSIVAMLDEFKFMLLGATIQVFNNHKNLTFDELKSQCFLCWQNKVEEFSPCIHYIEGDKNIPTQNLSNVLSDQGREETRRASSCL